MPFFVRELSRRLGRRVIDNTGLRGQYNFKLEWAPDYAELPDGDGHGPGVSDGPSIFSALQDQLGLKLLSTKGLEDLLVIDHIQRPSEN
jgi:uncharacterized protein (TIGR03435 family)